MRLGKDHLIKKSLCPYCDSELDGATGVDEEGNANRLPKPGDISICYKCANISMFDDELNLRRLTIEEEKEVLRNKIVVEVQRTILGVNAAFDLLRKFTH